MVAKIKHVWLNEPLRVRVYSIAVLVIGFLVSKHLVSLEDFKFYGELAALVLGVESARSAVTPNAKVHMTNEQFYGPEGKL